MTAKTESLEDQVGELLLKNKLTIATAESCTGGMVAAKLVSVPGISQSFMEGMVTYSNEAKMRRLGVKEETLKAWGAVSEQTAREMAEGGALGAGTDICIAITGLAGPGGGSPEKPVGLVYMACFLKGDIKAEKHLFQGDGEEIRHQSMMAALSLVLQCLLEYEERT